MLLIRQVFVGALWAINVGRGGKAVKDGRLFFFSNRLLSFTPFDPRIRLRFQTLLSEC